MEYLPNGTYPVKEVKINGDNYIFILTNDLMVHTKAVHFRGQNIQDTYSIQIRNETKDPILILAGMLKISSTNYRVLHTKEDIIEEII